MLLNNAKEKKVPRKAIFTKDEIIEKAFLFVREKGFENLSARNLAKHMGISTGPFFSAFKSFEEIENLVIRKAKDFYKDNYFLPSLKDKIPFKSIGYNYIRFAKEEPKLFKIAFRKEKEEENHYLPSYNENNKEALSVIMKAYNMDEKSAKKLFNNMSIYCFGLATLFAEGAGVITKDDVSEML